jgi:hypothetical protein
VSIALAIQGIAGMNSFSAGFLYHLRQKNYQPSIISVTSGALHSLYHFLSEDPEELAKLYKFRQDFKRSIFSKEMQGIVMFSKQLLGKEGTFKVRDPVSYWFEKYSTLFEDPISLFDTLFPAQIYESIVEQPIYDKMAETFNASEIGIITNAYNYETGKTHIFLNSAALKHLEDTRFQPQATEEFDVSLISGEAIRGALQLIQYGTYNGLLDGAYQFNPYIPPLKKSKHIALVAVIPLSRPLKPLRTFFDVEDFKVKMMFLNSTHAEISNIRLINRLIDQKIITDPRMHKIKLDLYEPSIMKGFFDYLLEDADLFRDGESQAKKFIHDVSLNVTEKS